MNRHPLDVLSLVAGMIFLGVACTVLLGGGIGLWPWGGVWPALLLAGAVAALVVLILGRRGDGERP